MNFVAFINISLAALTVAAQLATAGIVTGLAVPSLRAATARLAGKHAHVLAFIVASVAVIGSLTYSEILGYTPCRLCWFQRIFMYPQALLLAAGMTRRGRSSYSDLYRYLLAFSVPGAVIAAYHYLLQTGIVPEGNCLAVGYSASCAERFVMQFGYITIPMMALSAFLLIISLAVAGMVYDRSDEETA